MGKKIVGYRKAHSDGLCVTSHSGICPIPELDGHPNPEILVWDGVKLRNILSSRNFYLRSVAVLCGAALGSFAGIVLPMPVHSIAWAII